MSCYRFVFLQDISLGKTENLPSDGVDEVVGTQVDITDHGRAVLDEEPLVSPTTGYSFNKKNSRPRS